MQQSGMPLENAFTLAYYTIMSSGHPKVYVLILNYKGWQDTLECLESVYSCSYPNFEVVVIDNGSHDQSLEKIQAWTRGELESQTPQSSPVFNSVKKNRSRISHVFVDEQGALLGEDSGGDSVPFLTLIKSETDWGCYGGYNLGIRACLKKGDFEYLWILNNDTAVHKDSLTHLVEQAQKNSWGLCGARIDEYNQPGTIQGLAGRFNPFRGRNTEIKDEAQLNNMDYITGTAMLASRQCFSSSLLPDEYFLYFEDVDFCYGVKAAGIRFGVAMESVVYHKGGKGSSSAEKEYYFARNILHFVWKYMPWMLPFSLWYVLVHRAALKLFTGKFRMAGSLFQGAVDFLRGRLGERI